MRSALVAGLVIGAVAVSTLLLEVGEDGSAGRLPGLARAMATVPAETLSANFTDWAAAREAGGVAELTSSADPAQRDAFLSAAFDADLSAVSTLVGSEAAMTRRYGWSVLDLEWEMFAQSRVGQVVVARLRPEVDPDDVTAALARLGYPEPADDEAEGAVWQGGTDLVAAIDPGLTPALAHVAVLADERLVVVSDTASYVRRTVDTIRGGVSSLADVGAAAQAAVPVYSDAAAVVHAPGIACSVPSLSAAAAEDRQLGQQLAREAGGVHAYESLSMGISPAGDTTDLHLVMSYASADDASADLESRVALAAGPAVGQGGDFGERFSLADAQIVRSSLVLTLTPKEQGGRLFSDLGTGPLLFAWCGAGAGSADGA